MSKPSIRQATQEDLPPILALLKEETLPTLGVEEHLHNFLVAERDGSIIGVIGLEAYGKTGLLRSAAVAGQERENGLGTSLFERLVLSARILGIDRLLLLTNTAEEYFRRRGFKTIDQKSVTGPVTSSVEFSGACPSHAVCMELLL